jgi:hypothetical protein
MERQGVESVFNVFFLWPAGEKKFDDLGPTGFDANSLEPT